MAVEALASDDLPILPPDATPAQPSIVEQQRQHAADQPSAPAADDSLPIGPPSILNTSFRDNRSGAVWGDVAHEAGIGTRNAVEGSTSLPATLLDAVTYPGRWLERQFGANVTAPSDLIKQGLDAAGLPIAQTDAEKRRAEFIRGSASLLTPMGISAVAPNLVTAAPAIVRPFVSLDPGSAARATTQIIGGGTGAITGDTLASSDLVPEWLKPTLRLAGNIAGNVGVNTAASAGGTISNAFRGVQSDLADALERLRIKPRTMGAVSDSPGVQGTEAILTHIPTASGVLQPKQKAMIDDFGNAVDTTASKLNPNVTTADEAGRVAQTHIRDWRDNVFPAMEDNAWKPVNAVMKSAGDVVDPSSYRAALQRSAADTRLANMPETQKAFASSKIQGWLDALDADAPPGKMLSWDQAQAIKQRIGEAMGTPDLVASIGDKAMKDLYGGLSTDMKISSVLRGVGNEFDSANAFSTAGRTFIKNTLSKAISGGNELKEGISGEDAANNLLNGDSLDLQSLRLMIPKAADALAAWKLRQMAQAKPNQQAAGDTTSTGTFLTNLRKSQLAKPEGTAALYSDPGVASDVRDLGTVAGQFRNVEKNMNTSKTGGSVALVSAITSLTQALASGNTRLAASIAAGMAAPYAGAKALTTPWAINIAKAQSPPPPAIPGLLGGAISNQATGWPTP